MSRFGVSSTKACLDSLKGDESQNNKGNMNTQHEKEINIIVNTRPKKVPDRAITFEEVVALANIPVAANARFTVVWSHGKTNGSLIPGKSVPLQNGMKFDVTPTGES